MTSCPVCQKPVDPLRARHVRVVGVKVTAYCSAECRDIEAARAVAAVSFPAAGSTARPADAAVAARAPVGAEAKGPGEARSQPQADAKAKPEAKADAKPDAKADAKADPKAEAKTDAKADAKAQAKPDAKAQAKPEVKPDAKADAKADPKAEAKTDAKAQLKPDAKADPKAEAKTDAKADAKAQLKPDAKPDAKADPKADSKADARPQGKTDGKDGKPASKDSKPAGKGNGAGAGKDARPADKPDADKPDKKGGGKVEPGDDKIADKATPAAAAEALADEEPAPRSRRGLYLATAAAALVVIGAGAFWFSRSEPPAPAPPPAPVVSAPVPEKPAPPPVHDPAQARERAVGVLRSFLTVESLRVRRVAAAALGRQADPQAIAALVDLLPTEQFEIAKLDIAYGLARAKDPRGFEILVTGLGSARRDVKADAARLLAALKDARAESTLSSLSNLAQFRVGATEQLARLGNKAAIARLEKLRVDPQATEEDRQRAVIALGYARQPTVVESLRALLPDKRFNVGAAGALAVLGDSAGRQVLIDQLSISSLRVPAAVGLRRLEPALDASGILFRLMPDLESEKDTERVAAAEAILILTADPQVAEFD